MEERKVTPDNRTHVRGLLEGRGEGTEVTSRGEIRAREIKRQEGLAFYKGM